MPIAYWEILSSFCGESRKGFSMRCLKCNDDVNDFSQLESSMDFYPVFGRVLQRKEERFFL